MKVEKDEFRIDHLTFGFLAGMIISYAIPTFLHIGVEWIFPLFIFNIFYILLTFPLNGNLTKKLCTLSLGNFIWLFWNRLFILFVASAAEAFRFSFEALYITFNPFLNIMWLVSFWSVSLTVIGDSKSRSLRQKHVY